MGFLHASEEEKFYVFGVGQGNAQLAIYKNIGVLYDCGSSSQQTHPKIKSLLSEDYSRIIAKKESKKQEYIPVIDQKRIQDVEAEIAEKEKLLGTSEKQLESNRSSESNTYSNIDSTENNIKGVIRKAIDEHHLKHLFVFISHPDADHYNKLILLSDTSRGEEILPSDIPVTVILCGDWLGNLKQENQTREDDKEHISQRLNFIRRLSRREKTWVELPYYWEYKATEDSNFPNYAALLNSFKLSVGSDEIPVDIYAEFLPQFYPNNPTRPFQGSLKALLLFIKERYTPNQASSSYTEDPFSAHFTSIYADIQAEESSFNNIYIWLMNQHFDDINSQSSIISFIMPESKMHFICTGDAHDETFYHSLFNRSETNELLIKLREDNFSNVLMIPHHGSSSNLSRRMLEFFKPDLCVISSGNGKQQGHPNKEMIDSYTYAFKSKLIQSRFSDFFDLEGFGIFAISYIKRGATDIGYLSKLTKETPIFSTNVHGTIKFDKSGVYSNFSDVIEIERSIEGSEKQHFVVNFKKKDNKLMDLLKNLSELQEEVKLYRDHISHNRVTWKNPQKCSF